MEDLVEHRLHPDPIVQFTGWLEEARAAGIPEPGAMALATVGADGVPSARMVLLKAVDARGFTFFTNYRSRKGRDLAHNPSAALIFYWEVLGRQVRVEGRTEKVTPEESDAYFATRPLANKLSSLASEQSEEVSRQQLDRAYEELRRRYEGKEIPRPAHWGGYRVVPQRLEFWQRRIARLNDRIAYELQPEGLWRIRRLAP